MRPTLWTLLLALLLQLLAGNAWAWRNTTASGHGEPLQTRHVQSMQRQAAHCHDTFAPQASPHDHHHAPDQAPGGSAPSDNHHCCAIGLAPAVQPLLQSLPHAPPASQHGPWASLSLRPDLRPPI